MSSGPLILVVEDERQMMRFLRTSLTTHGYRIAEATSATEALAQATTRNPDVVLLDLGLPDMDGIEVARQLRGWSKTPILVLSARDQEDDKIQALDAGADDYLTKPFGVGELLARIRVSLRHVAQAAPGHEEPVFISGDLEVDRAARRVFVRKREVHLTPTEFKLLSELIRHAGKVVTHRHLLREVWGVAHLENVHYVRVFMSQLRQKVEEDPARPRYLLNEPGVGYRLRVD
ncbi:MAG: response regulator [Myxococcales bacterium]|nr:response regulator [Myxococcales bacterium]